jgi:hypothetical protein
MEGLHCDAINALGIETRLKGERPQDQIGNVVAKDRQIVRLRLTEEPHRPPLSGTVHSPGYFL